jgi:hypothetical protein
MARLFRFLAATPLALLLALAAGCGSSSNPTGNNNTPPPDVDALFQALSDSLAAIPDHPSTDFVKNIRYPGIRTGFDAVLAADPTNRKGHLGSALLDLIEVNYNARLWAFVDSLQNYGDDGTARVAIPGIHFRRDSPILGNQFTLLATAPRELMRQALTVIPSNLTVAEFQQILETVVIPALTSALNHLNVADGGGGSMDPIHVQVEDESTEIDMGELLFFHAATHAARAAFRIATAYDFGLPGPDGTYGWVDDERAFDGCHDINHFEPIGGGSPNYRAVRIHYSHAHYQAAADSLLFSVLQWNLEHRPAFLAQRNGGMSAAFDDVSAARDLIAAAVTAIHAESDDQTDDIVKIVNLTDIDSDIATANDKPNFATNFTTIEDVLGWVGQVLTGPYDVDEDGSSGPIQFTVDLSTFFHAAPTDWKALLPYHTFKDPDTWLSDDLKSQYDEAVTPGTPWYLYYCDGTWEMRVDVAEYHHEERDVSADPVEFTNELGMPIDLGTAKIPYLPDYTLGGLFPGADRDKWLEIYTNSGG